MRLSSYFLPLLKESPAEAHTLSHQLMLRSGMIRQLTSGIYHWLPYGLAALKKIEAHLREAMKWVGCTELLMPTLHPASLWQESGRYDSYGKEMLRVMDRHDTPMLFGPTHEEVITDLMRNTLRSYRDLPQCLYQIQWKFRDEIRPRFGVMRGREFLMKDAYSFDRDPLAARITYDRMVQAYFRAFDAMGLQAIIVEADNGAIGGSLSHEFHVLAQTGESAIYYDTTMLDHLSSRAYRTNEGLAAIYQSYAVAEEKYHPESCPIPKERLMQQRGIEVGHVFYFGPKYSTSMHMALSQSDGGEFFPEMGSYGIGVSRLVAAMIEVYHDDQGICWPESVAPFQVSVINLRANDAACLALADRLYSALQDAGIDVLYDDRDETAGQKFSTHDLIGVPWQLIISPRGLERGDVELKHRRSSHRTYLSPEAALEQLTAR